MKKIGKKDNNLLDKLTADRNALMERAIHDVKQDSPEEQSLLWEIAMIDAKILGTVKS